MSVYAILAFDAYKGSGSECTQQHERYYPLMTVDKPDSVTYGPNHFNWKQLIKTCQDATTSLNGERWRCSIKRGVVVAVVDQDYYPPHLRPQCRAVDCLIGDLGMPSFSGWTTPAAGAVDCADNKAKTAFLQKVKGVSQSFDGGTFLGELKETLTMIRNPAKGLRSGIDSYVKRSRKRTRGIRSESKKGDIIAETWLEGVFGWRPFLNDLDSAAKALAEYRYKRRFACTPVRAKGTCTDSEDSNWGNIGYSTIRCKYQTRNKRKSIVIYRGGVKANPASDDPLRYVGLTLDNFVPTAWNLIPYSFLVDYFTNIGDVLEGWSRGRMNLGWSNRTEVLEVDFRVRTELDYEYTTSWVNIKDAYMAVKPRQHYKLRTVDRGSYSGDFIPSFEWEIPGIGSTKWLNIAALGKLRFL